MDSLVDFLEHVFKEGALDGDHSAVELLEKLKARPDCSEDTFMFLRHAAKTGLFNLTVCEILAGKPKPKFATDLDHLQEKLLNRPLPERLAQVMKEAKWWDYLRRDAA